MTKETIDELERLHKAATVASDAFTTFREDNPTRRSDEQREYDRLRRAHYAAENDLEEAISLGALGELLRSARLALKAREWLVEYSNITGVALSGAEDAEHIKADRSALRALAALRKEFGLDG